MSNPDQEWNVLTVEGPAAGECAVRPVPGVSRAQAGDASAIKQLIDSAVLHGDVLPRTLDEVIGGIRDFVVYLDEHGAVRGCCAAHVDMANLAEIRSLVVDESFQGHGIGKALVQASIHEARQLGIARVYALTRAVGFFEKLGFRVSAMDVLPQKVFKDCLRCARYNHCDETAVILDLEGGDGAS